MFITEIEKVSFDRSDKIESPVETYVTMGHLALRTCKLNHSATHTPKYQSDCGGEPIWTKEIDLVLLLETPQCEW